MSTVTEEAVDQSSANEAAKIRAQQRLDNLAKARQIKAQQKLDADNPPKPATPPEEPVLQRPKVALHNLEVGQTCLYYLGANYEKGKGEAAIVTKTNHAGILTLTIFPNGGGWMRRANVFHYDDPDIQKRRELHDKTGTWGYLET